MTTVIAEGYTVEQGVKAVGKGWEMLVREAFHHLPSGGKIIQVKENFGGLRIYAEDVVTGYSNFLRDIEFSSYKICELCGEEGSVYTDDNLFRTRCIECEENTIGISKEA